MLSDRERETLRELEHQFEAEDPDFSRSFEDGERLSTYSMRWAYAMPGWVYPTAIVVVLAMGVLMLASRSPGTALLFVALAAMISIVRRSRDEPGGH
ncbi:MAG: DUF3040 domain-containing protein [Pseudonocardia sp.]|nr:DUF3040 domain-containing protein [Pseudonocardia sp.]